MQKLKYIGQFNINLMGIWLVCERSKKNFRTPIGKFFICNYRIPPGDLITKI